MTCNKDIGISYTVIDCYLTVVTIVTCYVKKKSIFKTKGLFTKIRFYIMTKSQKSLKNQKVQENN